MYLRALALDKSEPPYAAHLQYFRRMLARIAPAAPLKIEPIHGTSGRYSAYA
jgi:hypothetical protein